MIEAQNYFLENQKSVAVMRFADIKFHVLDPAVPPVVEDDKSMEDVDPPKIPVNILILCKRALDGNKL
eukprot:1498292-Ditylum_brightwellii.AAC.1